MSLKLTNHLGRETSHQFWDRNLSPELIVKPGAEVSLALRDPANGQITPDTTAVQLLQLTIRRWIR